ncbi:hypothetical protein GCM10027456_11410 [Kineosporia babensis]
MIEDMRHHLDQQGWEGHLCICESGYHAGVTTDFLWGPDDCQSAIAQFQLSDLSQMVAALNH